MTRNRGGVNLRQLARALDEVAYEIRARRAGRSTHAKLKAAVDELAEIAAATDRISLPARTRRLRVTGAYQVLADAEVSREQITRAARVAKRAQHFVRDDVPEATRVRRLLLLLESLAAAIHNTDAERLRTLKLRQGIPSETLRS
jgi:hypothetical protein